MKVEDFFDSNVEFYGMIEARSIDYFFINYIEKNYRINPYLLDIGGGGGMFAKLCKDNFPDMVVYIIDPSKKMLNKQKLNGVKFVIGKLPYDVKLDRKFDYIHVKEVFHHLTGKSVHETKFLIKDSLKCIGDLVKENGVILIHEIFYEMWFFPRIMNILIFYLLKIQNKINVRIPLPFFKLGLEIYIYTREEFKSLLNDLNFEIIDYSEEYSENNIYKNLLFLKNWGRMSYIIKKSKSQNY